MSAIDFAFNWARKRFRIDEDLLPPQVIENMPDYYGDCLFGQVIGYIPGDSERVIIELEDLREHCWPLHNGINLVIDPIDLYNAEDTRVIAVNYKKLVIPPTIEQIKLAKAKQKSIPIPPAYPNACSMCGSPARKYGKRIMCSNRNCDTRRQVLGSLAIKRTKFNPIRCPTCNRYAIYCSATTTADRCYLVDCDGGHTFRLSIDELKINDIILFTRGGHDYDRIWNGVKWERY